MGRTRRRRSFDILQGELDDALEAGRGDLERGLVILWERRTGGAVERVWPAAVTDVLEQLTDPRARARLGEKAERVFRDLEDPTERDLREFAKMLAGLRRRGGGDLERALLAKWEHLHPTPEPWGEHAGELEKCRVAGGRVIAAIARGHPGVGGGERLVERVEGLVGGPLRRLEVGTDEATAERVLSVRENLLAAWSEWEAACERSARGPVEVGRRFLYTDASGKVRDVDVDVLDHCGSVWVEVKHRRPFTTASSTWDDLEGQVRRLLMAAAQHPRDGGA